MRHYADPCKGIRQKKLSSLSSLHKIGNLIIFQLFEENLLGRLDQIDKKSPSECLDMTFLFHGCVELQKPTLGRQRRVQADFLLPGLSINATSPTS